MDRAHLSADSQVENLQGVGVGIYKDATHIGLLCHDASGKVIRFLHLAFHEDLRESDDASKCILWVQAKLENEQAEVVAAQARLIYRVHGLGGIPYGFSPYGGYFGAKGEIRWSAVGNGLTCSTFVLAVFERGGIRLVRGETWPTGREDDKQFQRKMIEELRNQASASESHLKGMKKDVGQVRFRVLDVAGAVAADGYPADFETADRLGAELRAMMEPPPQAADPSTQPLPEPDDRRES
jgi:hypothetical protein